MKVSALKVAELREELRKRNLSTKGLKVELVERLQEAINSKEQDEPISAEAESTEGAANDSQVTDEASVLSESAAETSLVTTNEPAREESAANNNHQSLEDVQSSSMDQKQPHSEVQLTPVQAAADVEMKEPENSIPGAVDSAVQETETAAPVAAETAEQEAAEPVQSEVPVLGHEQLSAPDQEVSTSVAQVMDSTAVLEAEVPNEPSAVSAAADRATEAAESQTVVARKDSHGVVQAEPLDSREAAQTELEDSHQADQTEPQDSQMEEAIGSTTEVSKEAEGEPELMQAEPQDESAAGEPKQSDSGAAEDKEQDTASRKRRRSRSRSGDRSKRLRDEGNSKRRSRSRSRGSGRREGSSKDDGDLGDERERSSRSSHRHRRSSGRRSRSPRRRRSRSHSRSRRSRSHSRSRHSQSEERSLCREPDGWEHSQLIFLDHYHCDLHLKVASDGLSAEPISDEGFAFCWAGARANFGISGDRCFDRVWYEVKIVRKVDEVRLPSEEPNSYAMRIGWIADDPETDFRLGDAQCSFGFESTGRRCSAGKFVPYGFSFGVGDVVTCLADYSDPNCVYLSFAVNGRHQGLAFAPPRQTLFPCILTKNLVYQVHFGTKDDSADGLWCPPGCEPIGEAPAQQEEAADPKSTPEPSEKDQKEAHQKSEDADSAEQRPESATEGDQKPEVANESEASAETEEKSEDVPAAEKPEDETAAEVKSDDAAQPGNQSETNEKTEESASSEQSAADSQLEPLPDYVLPEDSSVWRIMQQLQPASPEQQQQEQEGNGEEAMEAASQPEEETEGQATEAELQQKEETEGQVMEAESEKKEEIEEQVVDAEQQQAPEAEAQEQLPEQSPLVRGAKPPASTSNCEVILMVGLPGSGKTHWVREHLKSNADKRYTILASYNVLEKMSVTGKSRRDITQPHRWTLFPQRAAACVTFLCKLAALRRRNYIIDLTNVQSSGQNQKIKPFSGFKRIAVCVVPDSDELRRRLSLPRVKEVGKEVAEADLLDMKAEFSLPSSEHFDQLIFTDLAEPEATDLVKEFNREAGGKRRSAPGRRSRFEDERERDRDRGGRRQDYGDDRRRDSHRDRPGGRDYSDRSRSDFRRDDRGGRGFGGRGIGFRDDRRGGFGGGGGEFRGRGFGGGFGGRRDDRGSFSSRRDDRGGFGGGRRDDGPGYGGRRDDGPGIGGRRDDGPGIGSRRDDGPGIGGRRDDRSGFGGGGRRDDRGPVPIGASYGRRDDFPGFGGAGLDRRDRGGFSGRGGFPSDRDSSRHADFGSRFRDSRSGGSRDDRSGGSFRDARSSGFRDDRGIQQGGSSFRDTRSNLRDDRGSSFRDDRGSSFRDDRRGSFQADRGRSFGHREDPNRSGSFGRTDDRRGADGHYGDRSGRGSRFSDAQQPAPPQPIAADLRLPPASDPAQLAPQAWPQQMPAVYQQQQQQQPPFYGAAPQQWPQG